MQVSYTVEELQKIIGDIYYQKTDPLTLLQSIPDCLQENKVVIKLDKTANKHKYSIGELKYILNQIIKKNSKTEERNIVSWFYYGVDISFLNKLNKLYTQAELYLPKRFKKILNSELPSRWWEMYTAYYLSNSKLITEKSSANDNGPDFKLIDGSIVECFKSNWGEIDLKNVLPIPDIKVRDIPVKEIKKRFTQALDQKKKQYEKWIRKNVINSDNPYILAVNTYLSRPVDIDYFCDLISEVDDIEHISGFLLCNENFHSYNLDLKNVIDKFFFLPNPKADSILATKISSKFKLYKKPKNYSF